MRTGATRIVVVVLVVAAGLLGFAIGRRSAEPPESARGADSGPEETAPPEEPPPPASSGEAPTLLEAASTVALPDWPTGGPAITGHVRLESGKSLPGVAVTAAPHWMPDRASEDPTLEEKLRETVRRHDFERATRRTAVTGADGSFRLEDTYPDEHWIECRAPGYRIRPASGSGMVWPGGSVEYVAERIGVLEISVLDPDGEEMNEARIEWGHPGAQRGSTTWKRSRRTLSVPPGKWEVVALGKSGEWKSDVVEVELTGDPATAEVALRMKPVAGLRVRIVTPEGEPLEPCELMAMRLTPGSEPDPGRLLVAGRRSEYRANATDVVLLPDLAAGGWYYGVVIAGRVVASDVATVADRLVTKELLLPRADPSEYLVVQVLGPGRVPVKDVRLSTRVRHENGSSMRGAEPVALGAGRYRIRHHEQPPGQAWTNPRHSVILQSTEYGQKEVEYDPATDREITVSLEEPATLTVRITGYVGSGLEGRLRLGLANATEDENHALTRIRFVSPPDAEGRQKFDPVIPGGYRVWIVLVEGLHGWIPLSSTEVTLASGPRDFSLTLPRLSTLTVLVDGADETTHASLRSADRSGVWMLPARPVVDGRATFENLPDGRYRVLVSGGRSGAMYATVPVDREVRLEREEK